MEWILTKEKSPNEGQKVLTTTDGDFNTCLYVNNEFVSIYLGAMKVVIDPTHWTIPKLPKGDKKW